MNLAERHTADQQLKFQIFEILDGGGRHLENHKNHIISTRIDLYEIWYGGAKNETQLLRL